MEVLQTSTLWEGMYLRWEAQRERLRDLGHQVLPTQVYHQMAHQLWTFPLLPLHRLYRHSLTLLAAEGQQENHIPHSAAICFLQGGIRVTCLVFLQCRHPICLFLDPHHYLHLTFLFPDPHHSFLLPQFLCLLQVPCQRSRLRLPSTLQ
jgi:hypothetical protein